MTQRQKMFREIAEAYLTPGDERNPIQEIIGRYGICDNIRDEDIAHEVLEEFRDDMGFGWSDHWLPIPDVLATGIWYPRYDHMRGMFCLLMAELTDEEFKELGE